jgi:hypothetical protein
LLVGGSLILAAMLAPQRAIPSLLFPSIVAPSAEYQAYQQINSKMRSFKLLAELNHFADITLEPSFAAILVSQ